MFSVTKVVRVEGTGQTHISTRICDFGLERQDGMGFAVLMIVWIRACRRCGGQLHHPHFEIYCILVVVKRIITKRPFLFPSFGGARGALLIFFFLFSFKHAKAQANYVLNPSLEQYTQCPDAYDEITYATHWSALDSIYDPNVVVYGRPEYLNTCAGNNVQTGVPYNADFYHYPHSGNGMAGVQMFFDETFVEGNHRDYLQGRLYKPLTAGTSYCVSFYVTLDQASYYANNHIGAYLDDGMIDTTKCPGCVQTQYTPQVVETAIINDTLNWIKVEGSFIANGTERFITIGNFFDTAHTDYVLATPPGFGTSFSVYLVDDVSVVESNLPAYAGIDTSIRYGDTILIGRNEGALDCKWYMGSSLIDSGAGIRVHPDTTTTYTVRQTVCGLVKYDTVVVTVWPLGVKEANGLKGVRVYPNPSNGNFVIETSPQPSLKEREVVIYNALGQVVYTKKYFPPLEGSREVFSLDVPAGVYIIEVIDENGEQIQQRLILTQ